MLFESAPHHHRHDHPRCPRGFNSSQDTTDVLLLLMCGSSGICVIIIMSIMLYQTAMEEGKDS